MNASPPHVHLGPAIRTLRLAAGIGLREMARRIGVSPAYLSGVERETLPAPTHDRIRSLAEALGVPPERLSALSERLSPDLVDFLAATPEAVRFLQLAREAGLRGNDFGALSSRLRGDGAEVWRVREEAGGRPARAGAGSPAVPRARAGVRPLGDLLDRGRTWCRLEAASKARLLEELTRRALRGGHEVELRSAVRAVIAREAEASTGVGGGVALPHAAVKRRTRNLLGVCTLSRPIDFQAIDGLPVRVVFLVLGGAERATERLRILARVAQLCVRPGLLDDLADARSAKALHVILHRADAENE